MPLQWQSLNTLLKQNTKQIMQKIRTIASAVVLTSSAFLGVGEGWVLYKVLNGSLRVLHPNVQMRNLLQEIYTMVLKDNL